MNIGERLVEYRYKHKPKLTQLAMTKRIGVCSYESYRKWELGITTPNEKNLKRILEVIENKD